MPNSTKRPISSSIFVPQYESWELLQADGASLNFSARLVQEASRLVLETRAALSPPTSGGLVWRVRDQEIFTIAAKPINVSSGLDGHFERWPVTLLEPANDTACSHTRAVTIAAATGWWARCIDCRLSVGPIVPEDRSNDDSSHFVALQALTPLPTNWREAGDVPLEWRRETNRYWVRDNPTEA